MTKKLYIVTDKAGPWVAGQRKPADGRLLLSDRQAEYELVLGTIAPAPQPDSRPSPKSTEA